MIVFDYLSDPTLSTVLINPLQDFEKNETLNQTWALEWRGPNANIGYF